MGKGEKTAVVGTLEWVSPLTYSRCGDCPYSKALHTAPTAGWRGPAHAAYRARKPRRNCVHDRGCWKITVRESQKMWNAEGGCSSVAAGVVSVVLNLRICVFMRFLCLSFCNCVLYQGSALVRYTYTVVFTYIPRILILSKFFFNSPTDAQVNCLKNNLKIYIKINMKKKLRHVSVQSHHHQGAH